MFHGADDLERPRALTGPQGQARHARDLLSQISLTMPPLLAGSAGSASCRGPLSTFLCRVCELRAASGTRECPSATWAQAGLDTGDSTAGLQPAQLRLSAAPLGPRWSHTVTELWSDLVQFLFWSQTGSGQLSPHQKIQGWAYARRGGHPHSHRSPGSARSRHSAESWEDTWLGWAPWRTLSIPVPRPHRGPSVWPRDELC